MTQLERAGAQPTPGSPSHNWFAEILKAIRNPMLFNAFAIAVNSAFVYYGIQFEFSYCRVTFLGVAVAFNIGVTVWLNRFAWKNPRFLAYGPDEYLRESELEHERRLKERESIEARQP